jgi:hypothetical protein
MGRTLAPALGVAALLATAGCSQSGSYRLSWVFLVDQSTGVTQSSAVGCGQHGVDSIQLNGTDESGDAQQVIALCVPGSFVGTVPPGTWTFTVQMLNAEVLPVRPISPPGQPVQPSASAGTATISAGGPTAQFFAQLIPPSECNDGIDNDGDGRVDTGGECDAGPPGKQDGGTSGDGAQPEGGATGVGDGGPQDGGALDGHGDAMDARGGALDAHDGALDARG